MILLIFYVFWIKWNIYIKFLCLPKSGIYQYSNISAQKFDSSLISRKFFVHRISFKVLKFQLFLILFVSDQEIIYEK